MAVTVRILLLIVLALGPLPATAQDREAPYWASLRASVVNMRVGPSVNYPVEWVYRRPGLPVKVVRLHEGWRLVEDPDGTRGWIVARLLDPQRSAIVTGDGTTEIREDASQGSRLKWHVEPGVIGRLGDCEDGWCRFDAHGHAGWVRDDRLWGSGAP